MITFRFDAIGTLWQIDIYQELQEAQQKVLLSAIEDRIDIFDKTYSRFRTDSLVTKMSQETGTFLLPDDAPGLFAIYEDIYKRTKGLVTPLIGNLIADAGYDAQYSLVSKSELQKPLEWSDAIEYSYPNLVIKQPVMLDFGAAGKGYLIDLVAKVIEEQGIASYCVDAGGDMIHRGSEPIQVGLENPHDIDQVIGVYPLKNKSLCGSAGNRRAWGDFTHIINPETKTSPTEIVAVWTIADSTIVADIVATALFFVPVSILIDGYDFEYLLVRSDGSVEKSTSFSGEVF
jgi:thiamine biosynthesis lipoprotein